MVFIIIGTFGKELSPAIVGDKGAPAVVLKCIEAVEARGIRNEGIYRVSPSHLQRRQLKEALDNGTTILNDVFLWLIFMLYFSCNAVIIQLPPIQRG